MSSQPPILWHRVWGLSKVEYSSSMQAPRSCRATVQHCTAMFRTSSLLPAKDQKLRYPGPTAVQLVMMARKCRLAILQQAQQAHQAEKRTIAAAPYPNTSVLKAEVMLAAAADVCMLDPDGNVLLYACLIQTGALQCAMQRCLPVG